MAKGGSVKALQYDNLWTSGIEYADRKTAERLLGKWKNQDYEHEERRKEIRRDIEVALLLLCLGTLNLATAIIQKFMSYLSFDTLLAEYPELNTEVLSVTENTPVVSAASRSDIPSPLPAAKMSVLPLYWVLMPMPGSPGTPMFEGLNVTEFLERFEEMCEDYGTEGDLEKLKRLPKYCSTAVGRAIKNMPEWIEKM